MYILLFCLWLVLNGRISVQTVVSGLLIAGAVFFLMRKTVGYTAEKERQLLLCVPFFTVYLAVLVAEIIKASLSVMFFCLKKGAKPDPVMVEFRSGLESSFANELLANSITLTPGTYTVFQEEDRFAVHCLRREYAEGLEDSVFIRLLRRIP